MTQSKPSPAAQLLSGASVRIIGVLLLLGVALALPWGLVRADDNADDALKTFSQVLATVKNNAYRQLQPTELIDGAIDGMLATLDPHTHYLNPDYYDNMKVEQAGSFFGIGISFQMRNGLITVISPIEGTPAFNAGVRAGDQIVKINGESAEGIHQMDVIQKLRGEKGSKVRITIKREGVSELLDFELVRDIIPLNSISTVYLRDDKIGYIKVNHFSKTTPKELDDGLQQLESKGMQGLILDLRMNPGGLLDAAWKVVDRFIPEGRIIVSTDGRLDDSDYTFKAVTNEPSRDYPIVVLVDNGSASASEIVSGALQDWDRALIVGMPTFGKGLVQRLIPLGRQGESGALQLTTAEYFTPSKRNIQRPYTAYKEHLYAMSGVSSPMALPDSHTYFTKAGRKIAGGGGITPDEKVEYRGVLGDLLSAAATVGVLQFHRGIREQAPGHEDASGSGRHAHRRIPSVRRFQEDPGGRRRVDERHGSHPVSVDGRVRQRVGGSERTPQGPQRRRHHGQDCCEADARGEEADGDVDLAIGQRQRLIPRSSVASRT